MDQPTRSFRAQLDDREAKPRVQFRRLLHRVGPLPEVCSACRSWRVMGPGESWRPATERYPEGSV